MVRRSLRTMIFRRLVLAIFLIFAGVACQTVQPAPHIEREARADESAAAQGFEVSEQLLQEATAAEARGDYAIAQRRRDQARIAGDNARRLDAGADAKRQRSRDFQIVEEEREELLGSAGFKEGVESIVAGIKAFWWLIVTIAVIGVGAWFYLRGKGGIVSSIAGQASGLARTGLSALRNLFPAGDT